VYSVLSFIIHDRQVINYHNDVTVILEHPKTEANNTVAVDVYSLYFCFLMYASVIHIRLLNDFLLIVSGPTKLRNNYTFSLFTYFKLKVNTSNEQFNSRFTSDSMNTFIQHS